MIDIQRVENGYIVRERGTYMKHVFNTLEEMYAWITEYFNKQIEEERKKKDSEDTTKGL
jgi:hypothetical protein